MHSSSYKYCMKISRGTTASFWHAKTMLFKFSKILAANFLFLYTVVLYWRPYCYLGSSIIFLCPKVTGCHIYCCRIIVIAVCFATCSYLNKSAFKKNFSKVFLSWSLKNYTFISQSHLACKRIIIIVIRNMFMYSTSRWEQSSLPLYTSRPSG